MSQTKYRIPKMAMAVMVLGANGCGDDGGGSGGSTDSRFDAIAKTTCKLALTCNTGAGTTPKFSSQQECVDEFDKEFKADLTASTPKCQDAFLSYYECYVKGGCDADGSGCDKLYKAFYQACDNEPILRDASGSSSSGGK